MDNKERTTVVRPPSSVVLMHVPFRRFRAPRPTFAAHTKNRKVIEVGLEPKFVFELAL